MPKERIRYIDAFKGLCILLICLNHFNIELPWWFYMTTGTFRLTGFFFVTGFILSLKDRQWDLKQTFKKRVRQLGIPYLWFSLLLLVVTILWVAIGHLDAERIPIELFKTLCLRGIGTLWFLPVLFFSELVFCFVMSKRGVMRYATLIFCIGMSLLAVHAYNLFTDTMQPTALDHTKDTLMLPYVHAFRYWLTIFLGFWGGKLMVSILSGPRWRKCRMSATIFSITLLAVGFTLNYLVSACEPIVWVSVLTSIVSMGVLLLFHSIEGSAITRFFAFWGVNSLILMCTHYTITLELCKIIDHSIFGMNDFVGTRTFAYFFLCILATYPMVNFFNRKVPFFLGKAPVGRLQEKSQEGTV